MAKVVAAGVVGPLGAVLSSQPTAMARHTLDRDSDVTTLRSRLVRIDIRRLAAARNAARGAGTLVRLRLNLFDDVVFGSDVTETALTSSGGYSLSGRLAGADIGTMVLVVNGPLVADTVQSPPETYTIRPASGGIHIIRQVDLSTLPPEAE